LKNFNGEIKFVNSDKEMTFRDGRTQIFKTALEFGDQNGAQKLDNRNEILKNIEPNISLFVNITKIEAEINQHQIISLLALNDFLGNFSGYKP
jgi:hypothetical protein